MALIHQKINTIFLHVLILFISTFIISCHASQTIARNVQEIYPEPGVVECDTCPEPIPPPPPPPVECPPPPPPPCPPPPPPPEEPCEPCEAKSPPPPPQTWPPKGYYNNPGGPDNLYQTQYGYSSSARVGLGFVGVFMLFGLPLLQMMV